MPFRQNSTNTNETKMADCTANLPAKNEAEEKNVQTENEH